MVISQLKLNKSESWGGEFLMCRDAKMLNNSEVSDTFLIITHYTPKQTLVTL